ncbi:MAG: YgdI/YgdR family lipoprotein [Desulfobacterales bacterium]|nr:YgdI/YgdR family lipoprotein [Desulfobacterales bacterium]
MKKINIVLLAAILMAASIGCATQQGPQTGMIMPETKMATGIKAPQISYQDTSGKAHQLPGIGDGYTLLVFNREKICADENSVLIETAKSFSRKDLPVIVVEIIGGEKGCENAQKDCVLKRSIANGKFFTLCDDSGEANRQFGVNDASSLYLINEFGTIVQMAPYANLDGLLDRTGSLANKLKEEQQRDDGA